MDLFTTALELAGIEPPTDRIIDGKSLLPALLNNQVDSNKTIYYYRGNEMMAVRHGLYKAHYWTWTNSLQERAKVSIPVWTLKVFQELYEVSPLHPVLCYDQGRGGEGLGENQLIWICQSVIRPCSK